MTIRESLVLATGRLEQVRIPSPGLTAELLLSHCLELDRTGLYTRREEALSGGHERRYRELIDRRAMGEPLQYITGVQEFYSRPFQVNSSVLIPRPETEFVVEAVLEFNHWSKPRIADVGTGSGCIGVTLALELEGSQVTASDVSAGALRVARDNALRLDAQVSLVQMDGLAALGDEFQFIVSNPPYVSEDEYEGLQREVREHEPQIALVPVEGLDRLYERIVTESAQRLVEGGFLVLEIGYSMEARVRGLFGAGWSLPPTRADLQGIPRVVVARWG